MEKKTAKSLQLRAREHMALVKKAETDNEVRRAMELDSRKLDVQKRKYRSLSSYVCVRWLLTRLPGYPPTESTFSSPLDEHCNNRTTSASSRTPASSPALRCNKMSASPPWRWACRPLWPPLLTRVDAFSSTVCACSSFHRTPMRATNIVSSSNYGRRSRSSRGAHCKGPEGRQLALAHPTPFPSLTLSLFLVFFLSPPNL
jgi:hypothetical protein